VITKQRQSAATIEVLSLRGNIKVFCLAASGRAGTSDFLRIRLISQDLR
jgi:hypothetical protein